MCDQCVTDQGITPKNSYETLRVKQTLTWTSPTSSISYLTIYGIQTSYSIGMSLINLHNNSHLILNQLSDNIWNTNIHSQLTISNQESNNPFSTLPIAICDESDAQAVARHGAVACRSAHAVLRDKFSALPADHHAGRIGVC